MKKEFNLIIIASTVLSIILIRIYYFYLKETGFTFVMIAALMVLINVILVIRFKKGPGSINHHD
jgi:hypothetical protein